MTRSALTTFSIANDVAKYFAIVPALFAGTLPWLKAIDVMHLHSPTSAILSAVIFNALIIPLLIPVALKGVRYRPIGADALTRRNLLVWGLGGSDRCRHGRLASGRLTNLPGTASPLIEFLGRSSSSAGTRPGWWVSLSAWRRLPPWPMCRWRSPLRPGPGPYTRAVGAPVQPPAALCRLLPRRSGVGAYGLERGLFAPAGDAGAGRWAVWLAGALASLLLWMGLTALAMTYPTSAPVRPASWRGYELCVGCASDCFFIVAGCLRVGAIRSRILNSLAGETPLACTCSTMYSSSGCNTPYWARRCPPSPRR